jgi:DNA-binding transcriptional LysR family regulator
MRREELNNFFLTVAQERSSTRAAAKSGLSQSALSHAMRRLEERLGVRLLTRTTRSVAPTEAGEALIARFRSAMDDIDGALEWLTQMQDRPAGTIRITTSAHPAHAILWPAIDRLTKQYPDIHVELCVQSGFTDIVEQRFDAGVRLGEGLEQDMIAMPIGPRLRMATVASPDYLARRGVPMVPQDLTAHDCINLRMVSGGLYAWEYEKDGREVSVKVTGHLVLNDGELMVAAALAGHGLIHVVEDRVAPLIAAGSLTRVLSDWCDPFDGFYLYYPSRRQPTPAFRLLLEALRFRG